MRSTSLGRETQHGHTGILKSGHRLGSLSRADGNLRELCGIGHRRYSHVAYHEHTILTILRLLGDEQHTTAHTSDAGGALDDLQGRTKGFTCGGKSAGNLSVGTFGLDNHTAKVERVLHQFAGLLDGHTLLLAEFSQFLGIFLTAVAVFGVDECGLVDVGQSAFLCQCMHFLGITDENQVCNVFSQYTVGCTKCTLLLSFGEHNALLVCFSTRNDLT